MARTKEKGKGRTRRLEFGLFTLRDLKKAGDKTVSGNGTKESARTHSRCSSKYPVMSHPLPRNRTPHFSYLFVHINLLLMDSNIHPARNLPPAQMMDILRASAKDSPHAAGRLHRRAGTSLSLSMHMHTATATGVGWMMGGGKAL